MKSPSNDIVVACGLPLAGQEEVARQLEENGWYREDLETQIHRLATGSGHVTEALWKTAKGEAYSERRAATLGVPTRVSRPSRDMIDAIFIQLVTNRCISKMVERVRVANETGLRTVVDFLGVDSQDRKFIVDTLRQRIGGQCTITLLHMNTDPSICVERVKDAQSGVDAVARFVADAIMAEMFDPPSGAEGFDQVIVVNDGETPLVKLEEAGVAVRARPTDKASKLNFLARKMARGL